jgi:fructan beta-fructosidase
MSVSCLLIAATLACAAEGTATQRAVSPKDAFKTAVAVWNMEVPHDLARKNDLAVVGNVTMGKELAGKDLQESLDLDHDGLVAQFDGGYLDAGQGTGGALNLTGSALTLAVRLRSPSGQWGKPLVSKHGGHNRLVYNLFSFDTAIGFELGLKDKPGMIQVLAPLDKIGRTAWHEVICRYDGKRLQMFVDGVLMSETAAAGRLREGNTEPCLIGAESTGSGINSAWRGQMDRVAIWNRALSDEEIERLSGGAARVALLTAAYFKEPPELPPPADLYREKHRPQFHVTARQWTLRKLNPGMREEGWINDVNGLIFHEGQYHLFAQRWARCWLHLVSKDLVHWTELQPAFWDEPRFGTGVQSGTIVFDRQNVAGLSDDPKRPPLVAFWSGFDNRSQCISYSLDHGLTWAKYAKNPYMLQPERDPKVFWYEPGRKWVMVLYADAKYHIFNSTNLLTWIDQKHPIPDCFECPDLFPVPVDGDRNRTKWVLVRGNGKYSVGDFDGSSFTPQTPQLDCDLGPNFYATQSWGDIPGQEGRRVQIAWMRGGKYPEMPFNQQLSFPCDMTLHAVDGSWRVFRKPVPEIKLLHGREHAWKDLALAAGGSQRLDVPGDLFHILAEVEVPRGSTLTFRIRGTAVTVTDQSVACNSKPARVASGVKTIEILVDRTSIETFANDGETPVSACFLPADDRLTVECTDGPVTVRSLRVYELKSIWKENAAVASPGSQSARGH